ncbi:MAG TPA: 30S ribosomal protein S6 [Terriglobales bacterium]|nr:30S ribosomal protein S6 [Terriglobales bacterium]
MQRTYEVMFIVRPDMPEDEVEKLVSTLESNVTSAGGAHLRFEGGNQLIQFFLGHVGPHDKHQFVGTLHSPSP